MTQKGDNPYLLALMENSPLHIYKRGETVTTTEHLDAIWFIKDGFIKRFQILPNGTIRTQAFYGPGDIFPLTYVFKTVYDREIYSGPETYYYEALSKTVVQRYEGKRLAASLKKQPLLYKDLLSVAGMRFFSNIHLIENHGLADARKKLAHMLYFYTQMYGRKYAKGYEISLPFTQQDIADLLSLTRETVSTSMQYLKQKDLIVGLKLITIPDIDRLRDFAHS